MFVGLKDDYLDNFYTNAYFNHTNNINNDENKKNKKFPIQRPTSANIQRPTSANIQRPTSANNNKAQSKIIRKENSLNQKLIEKNKVLPPLEELEISLIKVSKSFLLSLQVFK